MLNLGEQIDRIHWIDSGRFRWVTREPGAPYVGRLDGTSFRLAEGSGRFAALAQSCRNDSAVSPTGSEPELRQAAPGALLMMTWRLQNTGTWTWDASYRLAFLGGDRMSGPHGLPLAAMAAPGGEVELTARLISPDAVGNYRGQWGLLAPDGPAFGQAASVEALVTAGSSAP